MSGRACTSNPFLPGNWSRPLSVVDSTERKRPNWATFAPTYREGDHLTAPAVTDLGRASIEAAVAAGKVRRFAPNGKEIA